jgi:ABC-type Fe3+/spermidine/putrescine transport system ATPase subunit
MEGYLRLEGLGKAFGGPRVLNDVSAELAAGECLVLLGPSGCGKTTLLNIIVGALKADAGRLSCAGEVLDDPAASVHVAMRKRGFAMVFQEFSLWPHMTVAGNVAFGLELKGMGRSEREAATREALAQVRMEAFADRWPSEISGGQQQRVAIARALAVRPRLLLLDEPLSALDARMRETLKDEIATLLAELGTTAVYVTHDQTEAFAVGHRIALMNGGRIEQIGPPEELYNAPRTRFTAEFIGSSNLLPCAPEGEFWQVNGSFRLPAPRTLAGRTGHLLLRRESVRVTSRNGSALSCEPPHVALEGICRRDRFLGDRHELLVELKDGILLKGFGDARIPMGAPVHALFSMEETRFLEE